MDTRVLSHREATTYNFEIIQKRRQVKRTRQGNIDLANEADENSHHQFNKPIRLYFRIRMYQEQDVEGDDVKIFTQTPKLSGLKCWQEQAVSKLRVHRGNTGREKRRYSGLFAGNILKHEPWTSEVLGPLPLSHRE